MQANRSVLQIKDFVVINSKYEFQPVAATTDEMLSIIKNYPIDIDFGFQMESNDKGLTLFTKVSVNQAEANQPGHSIFAESVAFIEGSVYADLAPAQRADLIEIPAVNLSINLLRGFIANISAYSPWGKYVLPGIDLMHLIATKREQLKKFEENAPPVKRTPKIGRAKK